MRISDWSSDVCSSDLNRAARGGAAGLAPLSRSRQSRGGGQRGNRAADRARRGSGRRKHGADRVERAPGRAEAAVLPDRIWHRRGGGGDRARRGAAIGRAACRERVWQYVSISEVAVALKKKKQYDPNNSKT